MNSKRKQNLFVSAILWLAFIVYTVSVKFIDVASVGNKLSPVGFSTLNEKFFNLFSDSSLQKISYDISEILGYIAILVAVIFVLIGFIQLIKTKSFKKVNKNIYALGIFYAVVMAFYALFEVVVINFRPVLAAESGELEASYPSSHTILALCILMSALIVFNYIFKDVKKSVYRVTSIAFFVMMVLTVVTRLMSGVHWFTDIVGAVLLSAALVISFKGFVDKINL